MAVGLALAGAIARPASADEDEGTRLARGQFRLRGYGTANYFSFDWDTDPGRRNAIDLERLTFYPSYGLGERVQLNGEIEFEHGGTGSTLEFDPFEEFGEFETEVEKGGEVQLEQMNVEFRAAEFLHLKIGRFKLPFGLNAVYDEPGEYFTTTRSETETNLVPTNWYENGLQASGEVLEDAGLTYTLSLTNGLDSSGFSSASWIVRGQQLRFETVAAQDLALSGRLDWRPCPGVVMGASGYHGNTTGNRPKPDLDAPAHVTVYDLHLRCERGPLEARALFLRGTLENADLVSRANRNLSNNLNVKRTPVGSSAQGLVVEAGVDVASALRQGRTPVVLFGRYETYDTMRSVTGDVFDNPRWERTVVTGGLNVHCAAPVVLKAEYSHRRLGTSTRNSENTFSTGIGFEF